MNSSAGRFVSRKYDVGCEWLLLKLHSNCSPPAFISASKVSKDSKVLNSSSEPLIPLSSRETLMKNSMTERRIETKKKEKKNREGRRKRRGKEREGGKERGREKETEMQKEGNRMEVGERERKRPERKKKRLRQEQE